MKVILILYLCSYVAGECLPPHQWDKEYRDMYDCMMAGYEESVNKMKEIGREEVNKSILLSLWIGVFILTPLVSVHVLLGEQRLHTSLEWDEPSARSTVVVQRLALGITWTQVLFKSIRGIYNQTYHHYHLS